MYLCIAPPPPFWRNLLSCLLDLKGFLGIKRLHLGHHCSQCVPELRFLYRPFHLFLRHALHFLLRGLVMILRIVQLFLFLLGGLMICVFCNSQVHGMHKRVVM